MDRIEKIFEKYRYESGTLDLAREDQLPMIKELQQELDKAREEGFRVGYTEGGNNDDLQMTYEWLKDVDTSKWI